MANCETCNDFQVVQTIHHPEWEDAITVGLGGAWEHELCPDCAAKCGCSCHWGKYLAMGTFHKDPCCDLENVIVARASKPGESGTFRTWPVAKWNALDEETKNSYGWETTGMISTKKIGDPEWLK